ncbi:hypothetical protein [Prolixibacter denitrificans]|uniref:Membrane protein n=1 Tax=Prolixibacter denitrificans TaxID=1541063 RepID=A0A2P8CE18_9BACT|nr:hypothetical protein [Prolixibacter denitrificans]PSK83227.1 hypothetical protein CLV93_104157 [Prolixibacter denitrificans]GET21890.1 membrane protein [Prolixibacter denitrificans]
MHYLLLSILSSTLIFFIFKFLEKYKADLFLVILLNYITASVLGFRLVPHLPSVTTIIKAGWLPYALLIGILFIAIFFLIARSSQKAGITITALAAKLSMVVPILYSILFFGERVTIFRIIGIATAILAVLLAIYKRNGKTNWNAVLLPVVIFLGTGAVDSMVKYVQQVYVRGTTTAVFTTVLFATAGIIGLVVTIFKRPGWKEFFRLPVIAGGIFLGAANFGSLYFMIHALSYSGLASSVVFGLNNMCIVAFSTILGMLFFREKLSTVNWTGIILSFISIFILVYI